MMHEEEEETRTLLVVREVCVYKIPVRSTSGGYKCGEWLQSDKIWTGRLRVVESGAKCQIRLEDPNTGELFATCPVEAGKREASVESALDSSRYFVLRIDDGGGRHAFIGLGFNERSDAFDFNVALSDHEKYVKRDDALDLHHQEHDQDTSSAASLDLRLKEGETMKINVKTRGSASSGMMKSAGSAMSNTKNTQGILLMAPPPGGGRIRSPLPPPPNESTAKPTTSASNNINQNILSDLSQLQAALPSSGSAKTKTSGAGGWAAF